MLRPTDFPAVLVLDFDGTVLRAGKVSSELLSGLNAWAAEGRIVVLATGRNPASFARTRIESRHANLWGAVSFGDGRLLRVAGKEFRSARGFLPPALVQEVTAGTDAIIETPSGVYASSRRARLYHLMRVGRSSEKVAICRKLPFHHVLHLELYGVDPDSVTSRLLGSNVNLTSNEGLAISLSSGPTCKAWAISHLLRSRGLEWSQVLYIGDGPNDVCAARKSAVAYAMKDGCEELKAVAARTIDSVEEILGCQRSPARPCVQRRFERAVATDQVRDALCRACGAGSGGFHRLRGPV